MKVVLRVINGQAIFDEKDALDGLKDGVYEVTINNMDYRTIRQNKALHAYYNLVAAALSSAGLDIKQVIKADVPWTPQSVKELMWRPIQKALLNKKSTTRLKRDEIDRVYDVVNRLLGERFGIHIPFPSEESR